MHWLIISTVIVLFGFSILHVVLQFLCFCDEPHLINFEFLRFFLLLLFSSASNLLVTGH